MTDQDKEHKRFLAALFAMNGFLSGDWQGENLAEASVKVADDMLKALSAEPEDEGIISALPKQTIRKKRS